MSLREGKSMRSLIASFALVTLMLMVPASLAGAQDTQTAAPVSNVASKEEVNQLRSEVAAQRQTIEELKALVEKLVGAKALEANHDAAQIRPVSESASALAQPVDAPSAGTAHLMNAILREAEPEPIAQDKAAAAPKKDAPLAAGWNGEHFFIKSADGQFSISPYGYVDNDYRSYT